MQISTPCRYLIRAMIELADKYGEGPVSLKTIEENQHISWRYLQQLMPSLKIDGMVRVIKGNRGGYLLARHPSEITVGAIIKAQKGCIAFVDCIKHDSCEYIPECPSRDLWIEVSKLVENYFDSMTLEEICKRWHKKLKSNKKLSKSQ
jgi:Rrf2 family transcriptional regulator, cysteine metabolism repressor